MKSKNVLLSVVMLLTVFSLSSFTSAKAVSECCKVTVTNPETDESATVTRCATTFRAACNLALAKAIEALE